MSQPDIATAEPPVGSRHDLRHDLSPGAPEIENYSDGDGAYGYAHSYETGSRLDGPGGLINCSAAGFAKAMDVSCHPFVRMARLAAPLMTQGGTMLAMSYHGASKVIRTYSVMGPVKAALETCCRYLAYELGGKGIRVHAISPGPLKTRAASGLKDFDLLLAEAEQRAPIAELVDVMDVGFTCAYLATRYARRLSGETLHVDGGVNIMA